LILVKSVALFEAQLTYCRMQVLFYWSAWWFQETNFYINTGNFFTLTRNSKTKSHEFLLDLPLQNFIKQW